MVKRRKFKKTDRFFGPAKPGEVRNPRGNPNPKIKDTPSTGPKTELGKLKTVIMNPTVPPWSDSSIIKKFRHCNKCPLKASIKEVFYNGEIFKFTVPAKCVNYKEDSKCVIEQGEFMKSLKFYFDIGEKRDTLELQKALTYELLENMKIARESEILEKRRPGFYTARFAEIAVNNLASVNRLKYGEINKNVNVNLDMTDAVVAAYKEGRKSETKKPAGNGGTEDNDKKS